MRAVVWMMTACRIRQGVSQRELDRRAGFGTGYTCDIERGLKMDLRLDTVFRYFDAIGMPLALIPGGIADDAGEIAPTPDAAAS